jgi:hypothetical protein
MQTEHPSQPLEHTAVVLDRVEAAPEAADVRRAADTAVVPPPAAESRPGVSPAPPAAALAPAAPPRDVVVRLTGPALLLIMSVGAVIMWQEANAPAPVPLSGTFGISHRPSAPAPALDLSATWLRQTRAGSEPLVDGGVVRSGDRLTLRLRASEPVWAYVLSEDAAGSARALFPRAGLDLGNPLTAGAEQHLPGTRLGSDLAWPVGERGGSELLFIVVARAAQPDIEALMRQLAPAARAAAGDAPVSRLADTLARVHEPGLWLLRMRVVHERS